MIKDLLAKYYKDGTVIIAGAVFADTESDFDQQENLQKVYFTDNEIADIQKLDRIQQESYALALAETKLGLK